MVNRPSFFYGWYLVVLMVFCMMLVYGARNAFSVFFAPVLDEFGWFRGSTALMLSLNILVYGFTALLAGSLVDRWKPRRVVFTGIFILAIATASCSLADQLWHFYLLFGVLAPIGSAFCGAPVFNPTIMNWFDKRRGLAIGLGQIGGGLSFVYGIIIEAVISQWGWRPSFLVMAGLLVVILLPLYAVFFYYRPEDKGMVAYGKGESSTDDSGGNRIDVTETGDWTLGSALKTHNLWMLALSQFCFWGTGLYLILAHQIKYAQDAGYSSALAASIFALFGIVSIVGQVCASISDKIGREKTATIAIVLMLGAIVALISVKDATQPWLLYVYAVCAGLATGLYTPSIFVGLADIFHGKNIGAISATILVGTGIGGALGPWLGGYIYDIAGSYYNALIVAMVSFAIAGISFWIAAPRNAAKLRARL